jgi:hypothetical protein
VTGGCLQARVELFLRVAHEDALPGREAVDLDDARRSGDRQLLRGGHSCRGHHVLGERLRALDPSRGCARAEDSDAGVAELVGYAGDERRLGPDDDEVDLVLPAKGE